MDVQIYQELKKYKTFWTPVAWGGIVFWVIISVGQHVAGQLRISSSIPLISRFAGGTILLSASATSTYLSGVRYNSIIQFSDLNNNDFFHLTEPVQHIIISGILGTGIFKLLGGSTWRLLPSNLLQPGAFHESNGTVGYLAAGMKYGTTTQRKMIQSLGNRFGCHSCGIRKATFIADHQPPLKSSDGIRASNRGFLSKLFGLGNPLPFKFFPQCLPCSQQQAQAVKNKQTQSLVYHSMRIRFYKMTGVVLVVLSLSFTSNLDVTNTKIS